MLQVPTRRICNFLQLACTDGPSRAGSCGESCKSVRLPGSRSRLPLTSGPRTPSRARMNPPSGANGLAAHTAVGVHADRELSLRAEALPVVTAEGRSLPSLTNAGQRVVEGTRLSTTLPFQANLGSPTSASPEHQPVALTLRTHALGSAPSAALHPPHSLRTIGPARAPANLLAQPERPADAKAHRALKRRLLVSGPSMTAEAALRAAEAAELVKVAVWWQRQSG